MTKQNKSENILEKLKEYKDKTNSTYENMAQEIGVTYSTMFRWLNKETKVTKITSNAIIDFLKRKNFLVTLLALSVTYNLDFRMGYSKGEINTYEQVREFESFRQVTEFIRNAPPDEKVWECEHWGRHGYCRVYDFQIVNTDGQREETQDESE